jgi:hypothetical protein
VEAAAVPYHCWGVDNIKKTLAEMSRNIALAKAGSTVSTNFKLRLTENIACPASLEGRINEKEFSTE